MINKYNHVKIESDNVLLEKRLLLDEIVSTTATLDDELMKNTIDNLVKQVIAIEDNKKIKSDTDYLTKIAAMTDVSVKTLRRIKNEGTINQGECNTPGKKRPRQPTVAHLDDWKKCTDHTIGVENKYKVRDRISETELEPFIISVRNDDTDSDFSYEGIEFLDSDFSSD